MKICLFALLFQLLWGCASQDKPRSSYGFCYQPLYWPSDCVEPDPPTLRDEMDKRRETYRRWQESKTK